MEFYGSEHSLMLNHLFVIRTGVNAVLLLPFSWKEPQFWVMLALSCAIIIAKDDFKIKFLLRCVFGPVVFILCIL